MTNVLKETTKGEPTLSLLASSTGPTAVVWTVTSGFGLDWSELELGWIALAAAGPHARPLALTLGRLFLATLTARIVYACTESDRKV